MKVVLLAHAHEIVVVKRAVALEKIRQVQHRSLQDPFADEVEGNHEAPNTPVAVQKRMDRLELIVDERDLQQFREVVLLVMHESLEVRHQVIDQGVHGRHEYGVVDRGAADPVLAAPELAWHLVLAPDPMHQDSVRFADQPGGERKRLESVDCLVHRGDVVLDFLPVVTLFCRNIGAAT